MKRLMLAGLFAAPLVQPVLAQPIGTVDDAKSAPRDTPVALTGSLDRVPGGAFVLRGATGDILLDLAEAQSSRQALNAGSEVTIEGRADQTLLPSHEDEIVQRWPVVVSIVVERIEVAR